MALLSAAMALTMLPATAFAEEGAADSSIVESRGSEEDYDNGDATAPAGQGDSVTASPKAEDAEASDSESKDSEGKDSANSSESVTTENAVADDQNSVDTQAESGEVSALSQGTCGAAGSESDVTWALTENPDAQGTYTLTFSGSGAMADYASAAATPWNSYLAANSATTTSTERGNGSQTFYKITKIEFAAGSALTHIGNYAFANTMIESLSILEGVTTLGNSIFGWTNWLKTIEIPASVTNLNYDSAKESYYNTFDGAFYLEEIKVAAGNPNYKVDNGMLLGKVQDGSGWMIVNCPDTLANNGTPVTAISKNGFTESNIVAVGITAFSSCRNLTQIDLPDSITSIDKGSFNKCYALTSFTMPAGVTDFGGNFKACRNLQSIDFNNVTEISSQQMLADMTPAEIGETDGVFCALSSLDLSKVTEITSSAFNPSPNLTSVTFINSAGSILNIGAGAFQNCGFAENTVFDFSALSDESIISNSAFDDTVIVKKPAINDEKAVAAVITESGETTNCATLDDAILSAGKTDTVKLLKDCQLESVCTVTENKVLNLDLNGHILRAASDNRLFVVYGAVTVTDSNPDAVHYYTVDESKGGLYVVDDSQTENVKTLNGGVITGGVCGNSGGAFVLSKGSLDIKAGNIVGNMTTNATGSGGINVNTGTFTMSGGTVMGNVRNNNDVYTIVDINGGTISGGTFTTELSGKWCASGLYPYDNEDGTYTVSTVNQKCVAEVTLDGKTIYCNTIDDALANAETGSTVKLVKDCQMSKAFSVSAGKELTLDLNGHVLRAPSNNRLMLVYGTLHIMDSDPDAVHYYTVDNSKGGLYVVDDTQTENAKTLNGGIITGGVCGNSGGAFVLGEGTLDIQAGNIVGNMTTRAGGSGGINMNTGKSFTMSGGSVMGNVCNNNGTYSLVDINGGTVSGGSFSTNVQTYVADGSIQYVDDEIYHVIAKDATPTKTGYVFDSWLNASNAKVEQDALTNKELYHPSWTTCTYTTDGTTISETYVGGSTATATLSAPKNLSFDGQPKEATVTFENTWHGNKAIVYKNEAGEILDGAPVNAGTYTATLTAVEGGASVTVSFTIEKAAQKLNFADSAVTRHINVANVTNTLNHEVGDGEVTYSSDAPNVASVDEKGTVTIHGVGSATITATTAETGNYRSATAAYTLTVEDHTWGEWTTVTSPNCTDKGSEKRTCSVCDAMETRDVDPNGHDWEDDFTIDQEPTCTTNGVKSIHCKNCDVVKDITEIPATGHSYSEEWSSDEDDHWHECTVCHEKDSVSAHTFQWILDKEPTRTEKGSKHEECSVCHYKKAAVEIPALSSSDKSDKSDDKTNVSGDSKTPSKTTTDANSKAKSNAKTATKTGDTNPFGLYVALLLVSMIGIGVCLVKARKRHE